MQVVALQTDTAWEDREANLAAVERMLADAKPSAGALVVLPEMFASGFSMNVSGIAESAGGPSEQFLSQQARRYGIHLMAGLVTRAADGRGLNQSVTFGPEGGELARYSKIHPFTFAGEPEHYASGERIVTLPIGEATVAPFICYDLRFPEVFRHAVHRGAQVLVVIANFPARRAADWTTLLIARAIENQAYVVGVNRCGDDPNEAYSGGSIILDPRGKVMAAADDQPQALCAELDLAELSRFRQRFPALADMRAKYLGLD
jgi:predicted amidohydrolase